ncbi:hypothetical protein P389DRAFT_170449 [Cystobasidium minutum MCA 4210]|uniref:uncharacterized protein n=1 Tax=Cystobasidium minutum MCA 4210 TaxID=1397322 RepID=UPI0034CD4E23|eukprot:jgi/Rhomi1/170449/fgenesh1_kg.4_\
MSTTFEDRSGLPGPASAPQVALPYPYITQYDPQEQATFYANTETGETYWDLPEQARQGIGGAPFEDSGSGRLSHSGEAYGSGHPQTAPAVQGERSRGEVASFYGSSGPSQVVNQASADISDPHPGSDGARGFGNKADERAQFGDALSASGVAAMAWKLYKEYRNNKHNKQQFRPPSGRPSGLGMGGGSSVFGGGVGGTSMFPVGGAMGSSYGNQHYGHHGRPDDRMVSSSGKSPSMFSSPIRIYLLMQSSGGAGLLSSLLDGGGRSHGGPGFDGVLGGEGMQGHHGQGGYGNQGHHGYAGPSGGFGGGGVYYGGPGGRRGRGGW